MHVSYSPTPCRGVAQLSPTSMRIKKRRRQRPITTHEFLRRVAWPIGESKEIGLWIQLLKTLPHAMMCVSILNFCMWTTHAPLVRHTSDIHRDSITGIMWGAFCGYPESDAIVHCKAYDWLPPVVSIFLAIPLVLFHL